MAFWKAENKVISDSQTTSYSPGTNTCSDIDGVRASKSYGALTLGQFSGTTTITLNSIDDVHTNSCVVDKRTGLIWNRDVSQKIYGTGAEGLLWDATAEAGGLADEDIWTYCDTANTAGLSGFSDWRIPTMIEMLTIINFEAPTSLPDTTYFPSFPQDNFWISTTRPNSTTNGYNVNTASGQVLSAAKITTHARVCLVRG